MIIRIVRMEFQIDKLDAFQQLFEEHRPLIRGFPGCQHLELLRDPRHPHVRYTYSFWENEEALNQYRKSELFGQVWPRTKLLFSAPPQAYSMQSDSDLGT